MTERNPNDIDRPFVLGNELRRPSGDRVENSVSPVDRAPPASGSKFTMLAIAVAVVLGAAFYGLNNTTMNPAGTGTTASQNAPATTTADSNTVPTSTPNVRDVTPRNNTEPGMTTGAAPSRAATPPAGASSTPAMPKSDDAPK